jgi:branched-chain amino acid transport system permease protein
MFSYPFIVGHSGYLISIFVMLCIYAMTAMSLDLLVGYGGLISIGQAGFLTIGAYSVAILSTNYEIPFLITLPLAGVITGIIGFIIGLPAVRLSGHFLAVVSLGFGISVPLIALNWESVTGGYVGLSALRPEWLSSNLIFFYVIVIMTVLITWILFNIVKSRMGRAFLAIRESEVAAQATGINVALYKTLMFAISAFFTGLAGGLYGYWMGFVSPSDFNITTSFLLLGMIVIGGLASIPGAVIGAIIFTIIPEISRAFTGLTNVILGLTIVFIILFRPHGIASLLELLKFKKTKESLFFDDETGSENQTEGEVRDVSI